MPYAPGGTTDVIARMVAEYLGQRLGQNIIVDNKPGKGAMVGTALVAKAPPDGYTLLMSMISGLSISPTLYGGADFDPMADFIHISIASRNPSVLVVNPGFKAKTFKEYIEIAKAEPGKLAYATSGAGSSNHLLGARLEQVIGAAHGPRPLSRRRARHGRHDRRQRAVDVRFAAVGRARTSRPARCARSPSAARSATPPSPTCRP